MTTARMITIVLLVIIGVGSASVCLAQDGGDARQADPAQVDASEIASIMTDEPEPVSADETTPSGIALWTLISRGGAFMIPIGIMSLLVVTLAVERFVSLRRGKILPRSFERNIRSQLDPVDRFNPSEAMAACRMTRSPASRVIAAMMMRTGQPLADVERVAADTIEREAEVYAAPIRWLTLAAAATPLMGLLGTVWGMIVAFHESTTLTADRSRSEQLSEGIYTALVTTLAGLVVAIPAAILALYLENRLIRLFHLVEKLATDVAPGLARFTGQRRMDSQGKLQPIDGGKTPPVQSAGSGPPAAPIAPPRSGGKSRGEAKTS